MKKILLLLVNLGFLATNYAQTTVFEESFSDINNFPGTITILEEGFDSMTNLTNNSWQLLNKSNPIGTLPNGWFQGEASVFPSQAGAATNSYASANYNSTSGNGTKQLDDYTNSKCTKW